MEDDHRDATGLSQPIHQRPQRRVNVPAILALVMCALAMILLGVAIGTDYWFGNWLRHVGLWRSCVGDNCVVISKDNISVTNVNSSSYIVYLALRIASLVATGLVVLSTLLLIMVVLNKSVRGCAISAGILLIIASLVIGAVVAAFGVIFMVSTAQKLSIQMIGGGLGYSFIVGGVSVGLTFTAGVMSYVASCTHTTARAGVVIYPESYSMNAK